MSGEQASKDGTPAWAYDEDGYCVCCGNGRWKFHMPECELRDALDFTQPQIGSAPARPVETPTPAPALADRLRDIANLHVSERAYTELHDLADALGDSSSQPSAPDPPASFKPFYGDE